MLPLDPSYGHTLTVAGGAASLGGHVVTPGSLAYVAGGADELVVVTTVRTRALLVGGVPFPEDVVLWWNFVARTRDELTAAYRDWMSGDGRFGVVGSPLDRVDVGPPPWLTA